MNYNPKEDGITHINIYSKGKTSLGKWLSNFTACRLMLEEGEFNSIEGYWYYLLCSPGHEREKLRKEYGFSAKSLGRLLNNNNDWCNAEWFQEKIKIALTSKILGPIGKDFLRAFVDSELPFTHYYNFKGKVVTPKDGQWIIDHITELRIKQKEFEKNK